MMKTSYLIISFLVILFVLTHLSCRKSDLITEPEISKTNLIEEKFFNSHRSSNPTEKLLVEFIRRKNKKEQFVVKTVNQIGYPLWDKAVSIKNQNNQNRNSSSSSSSLILVPFVRDNQQVVNAAMKIVVTQSDTSFSYLCDWQYRDSVSTGLSGKNQSLILMSLNKKVFGTQLYKIVDSAAFGGPGPAVKYVRIKSDSIHNSLPGMNARTTDYYEWVWVEICTIEYVPTNQGQVVGCEPGSNCPQYTEDEVCNSFPFLVRIVTGSGSTSGSSGGNTGGSGGGGSNNNAPPACEEYLYPDGTIGCQPGWYPTGGNGTYIPIEIIPDPSILGNFIDDPNHFEDDNMQITFNYNQDPWPTIASVLSISDFIPYDNRNCLDLAKEQISKANIRDLGYGSAYKTYTELGGANAVQTKAGVEYIISKLNTGKPVIVAIDNRPGTPSSLNADGSTDHFVVIVGSGSDSQGNYFTFFDNATNLLSKGVNSINKLYYNPTTGVISGNSAANPNYAPYHNYIVTQIRKNQ